MTNCTCHPGHTCTSVESCAAARRAEFGDVADYKAIREALALNLTVEKWESAGAGVYSICDSAIGVAVCFTQDSEDAAYIAACNPSAIRALLADLDAMRGALEKIAKADNSESGCYYTNRANISIARAALKGTAHE